jgi:hypothetical protein
MGEIEDDQRRAWEKICELGLARPSELADAIGVATENAERTLETLWRRRLVIRQESGYAPVRSAMTGLGGSGLLGDTSGKPGGSGVEAS